MKKIICLALVTFSFYNSFSQVSPIRLGIFGGIANYHGDLVSKPFQSPGIAIGVTGSYQLSERFSLRAAFTYGKVAGADSLSSSEVLKARNLSFQSNITEGSLVAVYNIFNIDQVRWTPYVFAGLAVYHFNPYTYAQDGEKVFLQPLTTEGQGISGYGMEPYKRTQMAIPFGGGFKYAFSERVHLGIELGLRKLFTDHLDDVSGNYADPADLLTNRGPRSVELYYRGDELPGGVLTPPGKTETRGGAKYKDYYYFTGLHLSIALGSGGNKGYDCPKF